MAWRTLRIGSVGAISSFLLAYIVLQPASSPLLFLACLLAYASFQLYQENQRLLATSLSTKRQSQLQLQPPFIMVAGGGRGGGAGSPQATPQRGGGARSTKVASKKPLSAREILETQYLIPTEVSVELAHIINLILTTWVSSWYTYISDDDEVLQDIIIFLCTIIGEIVGRVRSRFDLISFVGDKLLPAIEFHLQAYNECKHAAMIRYPQYFSNNAESSISSTVETENSSSSSTKGSAPSSSASSATSTSRAVLTEDQYRCILTEYSKSQRYHGSLFSLQRATRLYQHHQEKQQATLLRRRRNSLGGNAAPANTEPENIPTSAPPAPSMIDLPSIEELSRQQVSDDGSSTFPLAAIMLQCEWLNLLQIDYWRGVCNLLVHRFLPERENRCSAVRHLSREILCSCILYPISDLLSNSDNLNVALEQALDVLITPPFKPVDSDTRRRRRNLSQMYVPGSQPPGFPPSNGWRHFAGIIFRQQGEQLLAGEAKGTFLLRKVSSLTNSPKAETDLFELLYAESAATVKSSKLHFFPERFEYGERDTTFWGNVEEMEKGFSTLDGLLDALKQVGLIKEGIVLEGAKAGSSVGEREEEEQPQQPEQGGQAAKGKMEEKANNTHVVQEMETHHDEGESGNIPESSSSSLKPTKPIKEISTSQVSRMSEAEEKEACLLNLKSAVDNALKLKGEGNDFLLCCDGASTSIGGEREGAEEAGKQLIGALETVLRFGIKDEGVNIDNRGWEWLLENDSPIIHEKPTSSKTLGTLLSPNKVADRILNRGTSPKVSSESQHHERCLSDGEGPGSVVRRLRSRRISLEGSEKSGGQPRTEQQPQHHKAAHEVTEIAKAPVLLRRRSSSWSEGGGGGRRDDGSSSNDVDCADDDLFMPTALPLDDMEEMEASHHTGIGGSSTGKGGGKEAVDVSGSVRGRRQEKEMETSRSSLGSSKSLSPRKLSRSKASRLLRGSFSKESSSQQDKLSISQSGNGGNASQRKKSAMGLNTPSLQSIFKLQRRRSVGTERIRSLQEVIVSGLEDGELINLLSIKGKSWSLYYKPTAFLEDQHSHQRLVQQLERLNGCRLSFGTAWKMTTPVSGNADSHQDQSLFTKTQAAGASNNSNNGSSNPNLIIDSFEDMVKRGSASISNTLISTKDAFRSLVKAPGGGGPPLILTDSPPIEYDHQGKPVTGKSVTTPIQETTANAGVNKWINPLPSAVNAAGVVLMTAIGNNGGGGESSGSSTASQPGSKSPHMLRSSVSAVEPGSVGVTSSPTRRGSGGIGLGGGGSLAGLNRRPSMNKLNTKTGYELDYHINSDLVEIQRERTMEADAIVENRLLVRIDRGDAATLSSSSLSVAPGRVMKFLQSGVSAAMKGRGGEGGSNNKSESNNKEKLERAACRLQSYLERRMRKDVMVYRGLLRKPLPDRRVAAEIVGTTTMHPVDGQSYVAYLIKVTVLEKNHAQGAGGNKDDHEMDSDGEERDSAEPSEWLIRRRFSDFQRLDKHLRGQIGPIVMHRLPPLPPRRLATASAIQLDHRKIGLGNYLSALISHRSLAEAHEVHVFLTTNAMPPTSSSNSNNNAASHALTAAMMDARCPESLEEGADSLQGAAAAAAAQEASDNEDNEERHKKEEGLGVPFLAPPSFKPAIYETRIFSLMEKIFEIESLGMVRRGTLSVLRKVASFFLSGNTNKKLLTSYAKMTSVQSFASYLFQLRRSLWPGGVFYTPVPPRTAAEKEKTRESVKAKLISLVPTSLSALSNVLGNNAVEQGILRVYEALNNPFVMKNLAYTIMDLLLMELFPQDPELSQLLGGLSSS